MTEKAQKVTKEICSSLLILLFIYTATSKLLDYETYWGTINNQEFDNRYTTLITIVIPSFEYLAAGLLAFNKTKRAGFYLSLIMMLAFTFYIVLVLTNYYGRVPCSCGGVIENLSWKQHLIFNIFYVGVAGLGSYLSTPRRKPKEPTLAMG